MSIHDSRIDRAESRPRTTLGIRNLINTGSRPVLSNLQPGTIGATTLTSATVLTDIFGGWIAMAVVTNGGSATDQQIIDGVGGNIVAGATNNVAIVSGALQTMGIIAGLTTATTYQLLAIQVAGPALGGAGLRSSQVSKTFTTA